MVPSIIGLSHPSAEAAKLPQTIPIPPSIWLLVWCSFYEMGRTTSKTFNFSVISTQNILPKNILGITDFWLMWDNPVFVLVISGFRPCHECHLSPVYVSLWNFEHGHKASEVSSSLAVVLGSYMTSRMSCCALGASLVGRFTTVPSFLNFCGHDSSDSPSLINGLVTISWYINLLVIIGPVHSWSSTLFLNCS